MFNIGLGGLIVQMKKQCKIYIVYDGECPLCKNYARLIRIREAVGTLELINARHVSDVVNEITSLGFDLDRGMVAKIDNDFFYGSDAIHALALLSTKSGFFNSCIYFIFQSKKTTAIIYPFFRGFRKIILWAMRIPMIKNLDKTCTKH